MPRPPRIHVPGGFYHVMLRGNHRQALFATPADRLRLNAIVAEVIDTLGARIHAFCWMTNHIHLLMQIADRPLGKIMQRIASRYSRYRHKQLRTAGHLFERRYKAKLVDADAYMFALLRYIHLNPVAAGLVSTADDYPWSSHSAYLGRETIPWLTTEFGLSLFSTNLDHAKRAYAALMAQAPYASERSLIDETNPQDSRVLGNDRFLALLPAAQFTPMSTLTLETMAALVCHAHHVDLRVIRSPSRQRVLTPVRVEIARRAVIERIATLREVAEFLHRDPSSLSELVLRHQL